MLEKPSTVPNFEEIDPTLHDQANESFSKRDAAAIMCLVDSRKAARLLEDNIHSFLHIGIYEEALFLAMTSDCHCLPERWADFLTFADIEKLRSIGDPIPTEPVMVYRGVAYPHGVVDTQGNIYYEEDPDDDVEIAYDLEDFVWGYSWTLNKHTAAWFTTRTPSRTENLSGKGVVYYARVKPENILFCSNERGEELVVVDMSNAVSQLKGLKTIPKPIKPSSNGD